MGRGFFDIFCSFMFLATAGSTNSIWGYIMMGTLMVCGIFFIVMACLNKDPAGDDFDSKQVAGQATSAGAASLL